MTVLSNWQSYSRSLKEYGHSVDAGFLCPVCKQAYSGDTKPCSVSQGHIIPEAFGGSTTVLVCAQCEGYMGHSIEAPLINLVKDSRVMHGQAEGMVRGRFWMKTDTGSVRAQLSFGKSSGWSIRLPKRGDGEKAFPDAKPGPIRTPPRLNFALEFDQGRVDKSLRLTLLKAAYLASFRWLGYAYVLRSELAWVGRMLRGQPVNSPYTFTAAPPEGRYTITMPGFPKLTSSASHVALMRGTAAELPVQYGFVQLQNIQHLVILPPPDGSTALEQLRDRLSAQNGQSARATFDVREVLALI